MIIREKYNHYRIRIIEENLLDYLDMSTVSQRNKDIVIKYVAGSNYRMIGDEYGITAHAVRAVIRRYVFNVVKIRKNLEQ